MIRKLLNKICLYFPVAGRIRHSFARPGSVLVYLGVNWGYSLDKIFLDYENCYCFEANPDIFARLKQKYRYFPHVKLFNYAVAEEDGESSFFVTSKEAQCSSLSRLSPTSSVQDSDIHVEKEIKVPTINLYNFLTREGVTHITDYISDIQGHDLMVLRTMKPFIDERKISRLLCEVHLNGRAPNYIDAPYNDENGYIEFMTDNYTLAATGWGLLREGEFMDLPESARQMDQLWVLK